MYKGEADWTLIGEIKNNPRIKIPIIGNGDITTPEKAKEYFDKYGIDGIMIGRASFGRPWIFHEVKEYIRTGTLVPPLSVPERVKLAKRQIQLSLTLKGYVRGVYEMRRHLSCYFKGLPDFKETRIKLVTLNSPEEITETLDFIEKNWGNYILEERTNVYGV